MLIIPDLTNETHKVVTWHTQSLLVIIVEVVLQNPSTSMSCYVYVCGRIVFMFIVLLSHCSLSCCATVSVALLTQLGVWLHFFLTVVVTFFFSIMLCACFLIEFEFIHHSIQ